MGAAARRAGLSPLFCDAPISRRPVCFLMHTLPPFGPAELGGFFLEFLRTDSEFGASRPLRERIRGHRGSISLRSFFSRLEPRFRRPGQKLFCFWVWLVVQSRDLATSPAMQIPRGTMRMTTRQLYLRAAQQQEAGASPVSRRPRDVTIGIGSAALAG